MDSSIQAMVERMRTVMSEEKVTAVQLASMTGISLSTLGKVLRLETKDPSVGLAIEVAKALNVSADWLLGLSEYRNSIEEIELSSEKDFGSKDALAVEVYRKFCECTSRYKSFYAENFGVPPSADDEFQPPMCEIIYDHIIDVLKGYISLIEDISVCNNDENLKNCILSINNKIKGSSDIKAHLIEEAYRLFAERNIDAFATFEQYARTVAYGGGTKNIPRPKKSGEELNKMVEEAEQNNILAEIRANKAKNKKP